MNELQKSIILAYESLDSNVKARIKREFQRLDNAVETIQSKKYIQEMKLQIKERLINKCTDSLDPNLDLIFEIDKVLFKYLNDSILDG